MKFIHAADIHLDSPLCGLARYEGAPIEQMQNSTRRAFANLIELACSEQVDFVLLAGDLYDVDWKDYNTGLFFNHQMTKLREAEIPVFLVLGNHDAGSSITKQLRPPDNVREFSSHQPETFRLDSVGVAIHGQSFPDKRVTDNLSTHYPKAVAGYFNIGMLHTSLNGRQDHAPYAPCSLADLLSHGYDYWALGHVHRHEIINKNPWVIFPGNLQGRHVREIGAKGCLLVHVIDDRPSITYVPVDVLRWGICQLEVSNLMEVDEVIDRARGEVVRALQNSDGRPLAIRFVIEGTSNVHSKLHSQKERWTNEIRAVAMEVGNVWVEKISLHTQPLHSPSLPEGALGELIETLHNLPNDNKTLQALSAEFRALKNALPAEARHNGVDPDNPETIRGLLSGVEELLLTRLLVRE